MIHQHFKLVDAITAWENIVGGLKNGFLLNKKKTIREIRELCDKYGLVMNPEKKIHDMSIGEKQTVEIVKALYRGARTLILDEPTAVLTAQEIDRLFAILREMKADNCAVIIITHKLAEVMSISDEVTVFRKGVSVAAVRTEDTTPNQLAEMMVGHQVNIEVPYADTSKEEKKPVLELKDLVVKGSDGMNRLHIGELSIFSHEILGIAGIVDSGQREICEAITGQIKSTGSVRLNGRELNGMNPRAMMKENCEIGFIPEDRLGMGLAGSLSITENAALRSYRGKKGLFLDKKAMKAEAEELVEKYSVACAGIDQMTRTLSGGNIQKILLGREINRGAELLIAAYPVRGLDIGASTFVYEKLNEEKVKGAAVLLIAEDLDVMLGMCDRIAVLHGGELMDVVDAKQTTKEALGLMMTGEGGKK